MFDFHRSENMRFLESTNWKEYVLWVILAVPTIISVEINSNSTGTRKLYQIPENLVDTARQKFKDEVKIASYIRSRI